MDEGSGVAVSCGVGRRRGSDTALLWLWCRPMAIAPTGPLALEPPYAAGAALKRQKTKKRRLPPCPQRNSVPISSHSHAPLPSGPGSL